MKNSFPLKIIAIFLFVCLLSIGFRAAALKPIWNDEIYSQNSSVDRMSYGAILTGHVDEGNAAPLFYWGQKLVSDILGFKLPFVWQGEGTIWDPGSQIIMRVQPNLCMSLAIAATFYYFSSRYSVLTGVFSVFLWLSSHMMWVYWPEARPYALWVFLTTAQILLFLEIVRRGGRKDFLDRGLAAVHLLLSLTVPASLPQIVIVSGLVWFYGGREKKRFVFLAAAPAAVCVVYYALAPHYTFYLAFSLEQYIRANMSRDRIYILWLFALFIAGVFLQARSRSFKLIPEESIIKAVPIFLLTVGMMASTGLIFGVFSLKRDAGGQFPVSEKYFINLLPVGVAATTVFVDSIIRTSRRIWWLMFPLAGGIAALIVPRALKVFQDVLKQYPQLVF